MPLYTSERLCERRDAGDIPEELPVKFRILVETDEDGMFVATVPSLPGCVSQGATRAEAVSNVRQAIEGYVESLRERGEPIPPSIHEEVVDVAV
jgi:predicted RNase H-like HicB family nuclease